MLHTKFIIIYGFSEDEANQVESVMPDKDSEIVATDCFTDILAMSAYAVLVNVNHTEPDDLQTLFEYYTAIGPFSEVVILVGNCEIPAALARKIKQYENFDSMIKDLKYLLLSARRYSKKQVAFSSNLANAIAILREIYRRPGVTTAQLAEKLDMSTRSVQRYIETLRIADVWIEYDRTLRGWKLIDEKSL